MFNENELDVLTLTEPLACVLHAQNKIPSYLKIQTALIYGGGPIGALHFIELNLRFPESKTIIIEPNSDRRVTLQKLFPASEVIAEWNSTIQADLTIVATSDPKASLQAIQYSAEAGTVLLFSGLNHRNKDEIPLFEGINLESVHRNEEIRVTSRRIRLVGSSGYHKTDIEMSAKKLISHIEMYKPIQTGTVETLDSETVGLQNFSKPAIEVMLNEPEFYYKHLKVLFRIGNEIKDFAVTPDKTLSQAQLKMISIHQPLTQGMIRLKMLRASICQTDRRVLQGTKSARLSEDLILGHEGLAIVESVGAEVNPELIGQVVIVLPHHYVSDPLVSRGLGFLSEKMEHLGIHRNGLFATRVDVPQSCVHRLSLALKLKKAA